MSKGQIKLKQVKDEYARINPYNVDKLQVQERKSFLGIKYWRTIFTTKDFWEAEELYQFIKKSKQI